MTGMPEWSREAMPHYMGVVHLKVEAIHAMKNGWRSLQCRAADQWLDHH
jgi:hypothetical protein